MSSNEFKYFQMSSEVYYQWCHFSGKRRERKLNPKCKKEFAELAHWLVATSLPQRTLDSNVGGIRTRSRSEVCTRPRLVLRTRTTTMLN